MVIADTAHSRFIRTYTPPCHYSITSLLHYIITHYIITHYIITPLHQYNVITDILTTSGDLEHIPVFSIEGGGGSTHHFLTLREFFLPDDFRSGQRQGPLPDSVVQAPFLAKCMKQSTSQRVMA